MKTPTKTSFAAAFSVGAVLFSAHAGGGFATGNQANTYYVSIGWTGVFAAIAAMLLLTITMREAMIMYNSRNLSSYKELFETLWHPLDKVEILFEIFFYIMVLMAVSAAISGAATAMRNYFGLNYYAGIVIIGAIVLVFTIFGADLVRKASSVMGIIIMVSALLIYFIGIVKSPVSMGEAFSASFAKVGFGTVPKAVMNAFTYAGFQCVTLPTMIVCGAALKNKEGCSKSMWISFVLNTVALVMSIIMLMGWQGYYTSVENGSSVPTLTSCAAMGIGILTVVYAVCLLMCLISTGVTTTFGFVARFEKMPIFRNVKSATGRSAIWSVIVIVVSMFVSLAGLTNIIKYGYGYCGYLGAVVVVIPFITFGAYKNRKYIAEHGYEKD